MVMTAAARQNSLRAARSVRTTAASQITMQMHAALHLPAAIIALAGAASRVGESGHRYARPTTGFCFARPSMREGLSVRALLCVARL